MRIHPRQKLLKEAESIIAAAILNVVVNGKLTGAEYVQVLTKVFSESILDHTKYEIREERHGDKEKPGGLA